ncbi:MAG: hypothetical protein HC853_03205 [Anaerolineae bacterium]|nr:hypothetical protein [Anaerolineae bacterium]
MQNLILQVPGVADVRDLAWHVVRFSPAKPLADDALTRLNEPKLELARHELLCSLNGPLAHVITEAR